MRTRGWRRQQRHRWIKRRLSVIDNIWQVERWPKLFGGARLDAANLTCRPRCGLCHPWKRWPCKQWTAGDLRRLSKDMADWGVPE